MKINVDVCGAVVISVFAGIMIVSAFWYIPAAMQYHKEFKSHCATHDGVVYRTRDGSICLKRDTVITDL